MKEPIKSMKFVLCLSCVIYIVNEPWLTQSNLCSKFEGKNIFKCKHFISLLDIRHLLYI